MDNKRYLGQIALSFFFLFFMKTNAFSATLYLDKDATGSNNGTSWANAWTSFGSITGLSPGDTVYISGGATSKTYSGSWSLIGGTVSNPVIYKVGQDPGHNGTAILSGTVNLANYVLFDGEYAGNRRIQVNAFLAAGKRNITVKYCTTLGDSNFNTSSYIEIGYCQLRGNSDHAISLSAPPAAIGWDVNKIHHNDFILDQSSSGNGWGTDGIQWGNSLSLYNNTFRGTDVAYTGGQHQDGIQTDGRYIRVYNNTFINIGNYAVFFEAFGNMSDVEIFNNVFYISASKYSGGYQYAIAIGRSGGATGTVNFTNIRVLNNTVAYNGTGAIGMSPGPQSIWNSTDLFYNNVSYGTGDFSIDSNIAGFASTSNKKITSGASNIFIDYSNWDLHLKPTDNILKDKGVSTPSVYFSNDKDGISRPIGASWDIGAYEGQSFSAGKSPNYPTVINVQ